MSFKDALSIEVELEEMLEDEARKVALSIVRGLTKVTPVDTGRARGNWFVGMNTVNRSIENDRTASTAVSEAISELSGNVSYNDITISNNLPYIERLNDGHSKQAPKKFVESEISRVVNG